MALEDIAKKIFGRFLYTETHPDIRDEFDHSAHFYMVAFNREDIRSCITNYFNRRLINKENAEHPRIRRKRKIVDWVDYGGIGPAVSDKCAGKPGFFTIEPYSGFTIVIPPQHYERFIDEVEAAGREDRRRGNLFKYTLGSSGKYLCVAEEIHEGIQAYNWAEYRALARERTEQLIKQIGLANKGLKESKIAFGSSEEGPKIVLEAKKKSDPRRN